MTASTCVCVCVCVVNVSLAFIGVAPRVRTLLQPEKLQHSRTLPSRLVTLPNFRSSTMVVAAAAAPDGDGGGAGGGGGYPSIRAQPHPLPSLPDIIYGSCKIDVC